jgi:hypothetical protein
VELLSFYHGNKINSASGIKGVILTVLDFYISINPLTPNDLKRRRAVSLLQLKFPVKIRVKTQKIQQLFIQFINYVL